MIIIPMAGLSSRFFKSGYKKPKYMLEAQGATLFEHSLNSFRYYFNNKIFLFIINNSHNSKLFVEEKIKTLGIKKYHIVSLTKSTRGQAETVAQGIREYDNCGLLNEKHITIFNIDTFRPGFLYPDLSVLGDGYLEVFEGEGNNWSYVKPINSGSTVIERATEKKQISNLCCTGLYHFKRKSDYLEAYDNYNSKPKIEWDAGELYIAPLYNYLIKKGLQIHYNLINRDNVVFCGVPSEYHSFLNMDKA